MAQQSNNISNSWSFVAFIHRPSHVKMNLAPFTNQETGEEFKSLVFTCQDGSKEFVAFSSKLGELTPAELKAQKHDLQVVQMRDSGNYILCKTGSIWEELDMNEF